MIPLEEREKLIHMLDVYPDVPIWLAAKALGVSKNTFVVRYVKTGLVKAIKKPGAKRLRILSSSVKNIQGQLERYTVEPIKVKTKKPTFDILSHWDDIYKKIRKEMKDEQIYSTR